MARPKKHGSRFGRGRTQNKSEPSAHEASVATFPEPEPFAEKAADAGLNGKKPDFSEGMLVKLSRGERVVMRFALNNYLESLEKLSKQLRSRGLSNDEVKQRIALINGGDGLGQGIYNRLSEQLTIVDPAQLTIEEEQRMNEAGAVACVESLIKLPEMPAGDIREHLLAMARTWPSTKRHEVIEYCAAIVFLAEGEKYQGDVPSQVRVAIDRAIEWTMTAEDLEKFSTTGPWRTAWLEDDTKKVFHYAEFVPKDGGEPTKGDHGLFETALEARRCVARLNRLASLEVPPAVSAGA